jgi:hypothetical protein
MYASLRHYRIEPKNMDELIRRVPGAMEVISKLDGFKAYYVVKAGEVRLRPSASLRTRPRRFFRTKRRRSGSRRTLLIFSAEPSMP